MPTEARDYLLQQFDTAWALTSYHLETLTTEECQWRPAQAGLHVHPAPDGGWTIDWPDHEGYDLGPPSIGWILWHMCFWWSMAIDHSFGDATLTREDVRFPGSAEGARKEISRLHDEWRARVAALDDAALRATGRTRWPFAERAFGDVVAWATVELTKNASEIGYARFLYAVRES